MVVESVDEQYVGTSISVECVLSTWCVKDFAKLKLFRIICLLNGLLRGEEVDKFSIMVTGAKWFLLFIHK